MLSCFFEVGIIHLALLVSSVPLFGKSHIPIFTNSLVIMQKGESLTGGNKKMMHAKFPEKRAILTPLIRTRTCTYQGVRNVCFRKIWGALFSYYFRLEICAFTLLPKNCGTFACVTIHSHPPQNMILYCF